MPGKMGFSFCPGNEKNNKCGKMLDKSLCYIHNYTAYYSEATIV